MAQITASLTMDKQTARRLILACQGLYPPRALKGKAGVKKFMSWVRSIQFDPINVVGRNPDLVLQSRVRDFRPRMLNELLYQDRILVDKSELTKLGVDGIFGPGTSTQLIIEDIRKACQ